MANTTFFHHTKTPLTVWFAAACHMTAPKNGVSAKTLHRLLGFGSYETAWATLHRFRGAIGHAEHTRLSGDVEVDETIIGGVHPGKRGRGIAGAVLVAVAVEQIQPKGFGRCRIQVIPNAEADTRRSFLLTYVEPGSTVPTTDWLPARWRQERTIFIEADLHVGWLARDQSARGPTGEGCVWRASRHR